MYGLLQLSTLLIIAYQDLKSRMIDAYLFGLLSLWWIGDILLSPMKNLYDYLTVKACAVGLVISTLVLIKYLPIWKGRKPYGSGDWLLIIILTLILPPDLFLLSLIFSGVTGIMHGLVLKRISEYHIPFCTHLSLFSVICICIDNHWLIL